MQIRVNVSLHEELIPPKKQIIVSSLSYCEDVVLSP